MGMLSSYLCIHVALGKREEPYSVDLMSPVSRGPQTRFKNYYDLVHRSILKLRQSMGDYETGQKFMTAIIHAAKLEKTPVIETKALVIDTRQCGFPENLVCQCSGGEVERKTVRKHIFCCNA